MRALITGVLGQDGSYLAEQLLADGHEVFGTTRRSNATSPAQLIVADLLDQESLERALTRSRPDVVFNLAAVTSPGGAWGTPQPPLLADVTALGVPRLLDAMLKVCPDARLVHASSSAIYDPARYGLYGIAKQFAHEAVVGYRHRLHASNAVLFSHTSPRQDPRFLARRICTAVARGQTLVLGDVESRRDWGFAPDYMRALPLIATQGAPGDWVIASGRTHSVRDLTETALKQAGRTWDEIVTVEHSLPRIPNEAAPPEGRLATTRALGWTPRVSFDDMVGELLACSA